MYQKRKELNRENNTLDKQIFAENQGVFTDMICYLRGSSLSAYDQERVRRDLTEMVLDAQERGDTLSDVIGGDYKAFCDEIIASLPHKSAGRRAAEYGGIVCLAAAVLGSIKILLSPSFLTWLPDFLTGRAAAPPYLLFSLGDALLCAAILTASVLVVEQIVRNAFDAEKDKDVKAVCTALGLAVGASLCLSLLWLGEIVLLRVPLPAACAAVAALYLLYRLLDAAGNRP
ncbi:MAG: hypothetical protein KHW65_08280 [Clostridiales bacterium]|nr:hypothetical protein [Clostridiales bacterium]